MRARNIKPAFFTNEILGTLDPIICLTFEGLWCLADRNGILEDRPLRIKAELFPYRENLDVNGYLTVLERYGFVQRYKVDGIGYIEVLNFIKHQNPHHTEKSKGYPPNPLKGKANGEYPLDNGEITVPERSDSLIPDSLIKDSRAVAIPAESPAPSSKKGTRLPKDWQPTDDLMAWSKTQRPDLNLALTLDSFRDFWAAKAGSGGVKLDWDATWRNWVRKETQKPVDKPVIRGNVTVKPESKAEREAAWKRQMESLGVTV